MGIIFNKIQKIVKVGLYLEKYPLKWYFFFAKMTLMLKMGPENGQGFRSRSATPPQNPIWVAPLPAGGGGCDVKKIVSSIDHLIDWIKKIVWSIGSLIFFFNWSHLYVHQLSAAIFYPENVLSQTNRQLWVAQVTCSQSHGHVDGHWVWVNQRQPCTHRRWFLPEKKCKLLRP